MPTKEIVFAFLLIGVLGCQTTTPNSSSGDTYSDVVVVGAMRNVMWKGQLEGRIQLDTIQNRNGLYGLGPESYLTGELLISDGQAFVSRVGVDSGMIIDKTFDVSAPFFVYGHVDKWQQLALPDDVKTIRDLEQLIDNNTREKKRPFPFKLSGQVRNADIHIQSLPPGTKVSSPDEAHQGQITYKLNDEQVEIVGFFSTEHKGVFTHHDSNLHLHLITADRKQMGHLDRVEFDQMTLYLPLK